MHHYRLLRTVATAAVAVGSLSPILALAQTSNQAAASEAGGDITDAIIVTANKRSENIQRVATSITAISGNDLATQGKRQIDEVLQGVAGVKMQRVSSGFAVAVRGIGVETTAGIGDPGVANNMDEVYTDVPEAGRIGFYDINRVEVLRGPQGTLYGRNSTAGVLNVISNDPTFERKGAFSAGLSNYNGFDINAMANVPVTDTLAIRGAFYKMNHDGYLNNGQQDANDLGARLKVLLETGGARLLVGGEYGEVDGQGSTGAVPFDSCSGDHCFVTNNRTGNRFRFNTRKVWAKGNVDLGFANLTAISSYQRFQSATATNLGAYFIRYSTQEIQKALELRLSSADGEKISWQAGAFLYDSNRPTVTTSPITQAQRSQTKSIAGFADVTVPIGDWFKINGGIRQTRDKKDIDIVQVVSGVSSSNSLHRKFSHFDWKINLQAQITNDSMVYAKVATGFRSGGLYGTASSNSFNPENVTSYEVGSKNKLFNNLLVLNFDAFYYDYNNYQATNVVFVGGAPVQAVFNAPGAKTYGGELESSLNISQADRIDFSAAYLHARFKDGFTQGGVDYSGRPLGHAPAWHLTGAYQHTFDLGDAGHLTVRGDTTYESRSSTTFLFQRYAIQHPYWQSNAQITYLPTSQITLSAYIRNIENVAVKGNYLSQGPTVTLMPPRTYGVRAAFTF